MIIVKINYCPSCGSELIERSFVCPSCSLDIEELFAKGYLLESNNEDNSIELFEGNEEIIVVDDEISNGPEVDMSGDEIVIVVPNGADKDEFVIDLDELGIDVENMAKNINIVIQVDGSDFEDDFELDGDVPICDWYFEDDPYEIVYYRFVNMED